MKNTNADIAVPIPVRDVLILCEHQPTGVLRVEPVHRRMLPRSGVFADTGILKCRHSTYCSTRCTFVPRGRRTHFSMMLASWQRPQRATNDRLRCHATTQKLMSIAHRENRNR